MSPTTTVRENFTPFAYLDHGNPFNLGPAFVGVYGVTLWGVGVWLLYWHQFQRNWVTLRSLDPVHAERMRYTETLLPACVLDALEATMPPGMRRLAPQIVEAPFAGAMSAAREPGEDSGNSG